MNLELVKKERAAAETRLAEVQRRMDATGSIGEWREMLSEEALLMYDMHWLEDFEKALESLLK